MLEGHAEVAELLRASGASARTFSAADEFQVAILAGDEPEARRILAATPSVATESRALDAAARHGRLDAVELALSLGAPIDARDHAGLTALHHAARAGNLALVRALVAHGASTTLRDPTYNGTALGHARHFASRWPRPQAADVIAFLETR